MELGRLADGRPFVNVASAGLASAAARRAQPFKSFLGPLAYPLGALQAAVTEHAAALHGLRRRRGGLRRRGVAGDRRGHRRVRRRRGDRRRRPRRRRARRRDPARRLAPRPRPPRLGPAPRHDRRAGRRLPRPRHAWSRSTLPPGTRVQRRRRGARPAAWSASPSSTTPTSWWSADGVRQPRPRGRPRHRQHARVRARPRDRRLRAVGDRGRRRPRRGLRRRRRGAPHDRPHARPRSPPRGRCATA